jgi:hypothetical protein
MLAGHRRDRKAAACGEVDQDRQRLGLDIKVPD